MISLRNSSLKNVLPQTLGNTPEVQALDYAISNQISNLLDKSDQTRLWCAMNTLPAKILDIMALELRTHYYDESLPVDVKRQLVINTIKRYQKAGTPAAVEELLSIIFGNGELLEWFDYGGEPHHFKVSVESQLATTTKADDFLRLLESIKRKSSHLDKIEVVATGEAKYYIGIVSHEVEITVNGG